MVNVSDNIKEWDRGETIRVQNTYTDSADVVYDPDSIQLKVYGPDGAVDTTVTYAAGEITKLSTGIYYYDYSIATDASTGWWITEWSAVIDAQTDVASGQFKVRDPISRLYTQPAYVYSRAGQDENFVSKEDVEYFIRESMGEVDSLMGKKYDYNTSVTEWFDTSQPNKNTKVTKLFLGKTPIRAMTSVEEYDTNGDLTETHTSSDYYVDMDTGTLGLYTKEFEHQARRVKVVYSYGFDVIPANIQQLTTVIATLKMLLNHIGSSVDDITSYSACGLSLCFTGEMNLLTAGGYKTFESLEDKDIEIINKDGIISQSHVWSTGEKEVIKVKFHNGIEIRCTPDHKFMLYNGEECRADNLLGREVLNYEGIGVKVISLELNKKEKIYDFTEPLTNWGVVNGLIVHNSVGEPYTASARAIELLTKEKDRIIAAFGRQRQSIFIV